MKILATIPAMPHPLLASALCAILHTKPSASPASSGPSAWSPTEDPYVLDGSTLISPWYQYQMTELSATGGGIGGLLVSGGLLVAIYGTEGMDDARPLGMSAYTLIVASGVGGAATAAGFAAAAFRPSQTTRSSVPALLGAYGGAALGFGIGIPMVTSYEGDPLVGGLLWGIAIPLLSTSLGAMLGDLAGEPPRPQPFAPTPKSSPGWVRPLSWTPFWSPDGPSGLALTLPLDL